MKQRILLFDTSAVLHSVKFSLAKQKLSHREKPTFIVFGFLLKLQFLMNKTRPDIVVFATDSLKSKRKKIFPAYKEHRAMHHKTEEQQELDKISYPQFEQIIDYVLPKLGFKNIFNASGFEADDIVAKLCKEYQRHEIIIVSRDADLYQLISKTSCMLFPNNNTYFTKKDFKRRYKINPKQWRKVKTLAGCFDKKTEVLTNRGWVLFPNIQSTDKVYSMCPNSKIAKYEKITNTIKYKNKKKMYKIAGTLVDLVVTPNHEFFGSATQAYPSDKSKNVVRFKEIQDIVNYKNFTIPITSLWEGKEQEFFFLPEHTNKWVSKAKNGTKTPITKINKAKKIKMIHWLAFFGIWLADGYVTKNRNGKIGTIGISANKKRKVKQFQKILDSTPWNWSKHEKGWKVDNVQLANYLHIIGNTYTKYIPQEFKDLSMPLLQILMKSMMKGDGCAHSSKQSIFGTEEKVYTSSEYYSVNKKLIDDFQEIVTKCGYSSTLGSIPPKKWYINEKSGWSKKQYILRINKSKSLNLKNKKITKIKFNDYVYDITTEPNHTLFVRRNGHVCWSGNCTTDGVPGIEGIGEKRAIQYIKGELPKNYKAFKNIECKEGKTIAKRNKKLVVLPFKGTPSFRISPDRVKKKKLIKIAEEFGFASILADIDSWARSLKAH